MTRSIAQPDQPQRVTDLLIRQKCEAMIEYGYVALRQFPKAERHVLAAEMRGSMWALLRLIVVCHKRYHKKTTLQELDTELDQVFPVHGFRGRALDFLGYRIWPTHRKLRRSSIRRITQTLKRLQQLYAARQVSLERISQSVGSWLAHAGHANARGLVLAVLGRFKFSRSPA